MSTNSALLERLRAAAMNRVVPGVSKRALCAEAATHIQNLEAWIEGDAVCPCCQEMKKCNDGCTFDVDDPSGAEHMDEARRILYGD